MDNRYVESKQRVLQRRWKAKTLQKRTELRQA
jgi:hypothetical protein